jgi:F0F1-type ATP synthase alpha subunit
MEVTPIQQQEHLSSIPSIKFKTAFEELSNKHALLNCGIEKIDSTLKLTSGDRLAIIGNQYTQTIITRLCVNALLSSPSSKKRMMAN